MIIHPPFRVIVIDDDSKKPEIEDSEWIKYGDEEIVTDVFSDLISGEQSYKLLNKNPEPYKGYLASRFQVSTIHSVN